MTIALRQRRAAAGPSRWVTTLYGALAWFAALVFFFPVLWMVITAFKSEKNAQSTSPNLNLEGLAADGVREFLLLVLPLLIPGATGSPVRPVAVVGSD